MARKRTQRTAQARRPSPALCAQRAPPFQINWGGVQLWWPQACLAQRSGVLQSAFLASFFFPFSSAVFNFPLQHRPMEGFLPAALLLGLIGPMLKPSGCGRGVARTVISLSLPGLHASRTEAPSVSKISSCIPCISRGLPAAAKECRIRRHGPIIMALG